MENLNLREGDIVRIAPLSVDEVAEGRFRPKGLDHFIPNGFISEVLARFESPEETISRLKSEQNAILQIVQEKQEWVDRLLVEKQELTFRVTALEASFSEKKNEQTEQAFREAGFSESAIDFAMSTVEEKPWYPPQQEGYGPWIEGPPSLDLDGPFQALTPGERARDFAYSSTELYFAKNWPEAVAHCLPLEAGK